MSSSAQFASDVHYYLSLHPPQLPSRYLYDALGSALFEAICHLPWYSITRAESRLLDRFAADILDAVPALTTIVELGGGSGDKLVRLLESGERNVAPLDIHLIDVSPTALAASIRALSALSAANVVTHEASYEVGLRQVWGRQHDGATLVLFLGSNIGNFDRPGAAALLRSVRATLGRGDGLLLGTDLVKPEADLLLAYDDPLGVTAAFNRNLLVRINRELGADFDIDSFAHRAIWNRIASRVEMHLVSRRSERIQVPGAALDFTIAEQQTIWTESSYKYETDEVVQSLAQAGYRVIGQWVDEEGRFALTLATPDASGACGHASPRP